MRASIAVVVLLVACGGGGSSSAPDANLGDDPPDAGVIDGGLVWDDGGTCGTRWRLEPRDATSLALLGSEPVNGGRTARFVVGVTIGGCEEIAMPQVGFTLENEYAIISLYAWVPVDVDCTEPPQELFRPVTMQLYEDPSWSVSATGFATPVVLAVGPDPGNCDPTRTPCAADCDCDLGEKCLSFDSLGGPTTGCGAPCEVDRDCGGTCVTGIDDGLEWVCSSDPECGNGDPCPVGWSCSGGTCQPGFVLSQSSRHECGCDAECDPGLRCVEAYDPNQRPRCQAICQTAGNWCQGPHFCGSLGQDVSGLAGTDSVCGWVGE